MTLPRYIIVLFAATMLLFSCKKEEQKEEPKEHYGTTNGRTVLVYIVADNNMSTQALIDIREMLIGAKYLGDKDHLMIYLDDNSSPRIYYVTNSNAGQAYKDLTPVFSFSSEVNSCTYDQLLWVLNYMKEHYAAESYGLVMWSHGSGWLPATPSANPKTYGVKSRSFGLDNENGKSFTGHQMDIEEIAQAIEDFKKVDFLIFDACFMQNIEVVYALRNTAKTIISSPAEVPGDGAPYHTMLKPMFEDEGYVTGMVDEYYNVYKSSTIYGILLSAVNCESLEHFAEVTRVYVQKYKQELLTTEYVDDNNNPTILDYFWFDKYTSSSLQYPDYYDIKGLMKKVMTTEDYAVWSEELNKIIGASVYTNLWFSAAMNKQYKTVDGDQYSGVSMHVPLEKYAVKDSGFKRFASSYYDTEWAQKVWE